MVTLTSDPFPVLSGLHLTGIEESGVEWITESLEGWEGSPQSTISVKQKPRSSGGWAGHAFTEARSLVGNGWVFAPTAAMLKDAINRLNAASTNDETTLVVTQDGVTQSATVRRAGAVIANTLGLAARWSIQLVATDPRKFSPPLTGTTKLPASSGGLSVPFSVPFSIGAVSVSGQVSLTNPGNAFGPVLLRIDGPANGPSVTHVGSGRSLTFSSSLVLTAGEWIDVDMEKRTVLANGQSSRAAYVTSRGYSSFEPGPNTWALTAATFNAGTMLTVTATPANK